MSCQTLILLYRLLPKPRLCSQGAKSFCPWIVLLERHSLQGVLRPLLWNQVPVTSRLPGHGCEATSQLERTCRCGVMQTTGLLTPQLHCLPWASLREPMKCVEALVRCCIWLPSLRCMMKCMHSNDFSWQRSQFRSLELLCLPPSF